MKKGIQYLLTFLILCSLWLPYMTVKAQSYNIDEATKSFLAWYETNKDKPRATYTLQQDIYLKSGTKEQPIRFDGNGSIDIDCGMYSIYVESDVIIDNENLYILGDWRSLVSTVIVRNLDNQKQANLYLQKGGIYSSQSGIDIRSGQLHSPQGTNRFQIVAGTDDTPALRVSTPSIYLQNLDITASGNKQVIGVLAQQDIQLHNCKIEAQSMNNNNVIAVQAGNNLTVQNSQITAQGTQAQSLVSSSGNSHILVDEQTALIPKLPLPPQVEPRYRMTQMSDIATIVVPLGMQNISLPSYIQSLLTSYSDPSQQVTRAMQVDWNYEQVRTCIQSYGECVITGEFSQAQLQAERIYVQDSLQPKVTVKVVPITAMNKILIAQIEPSTNPLIEIQILRPYNANELRIEYSDDGKVWESGTCKNSLDQSDTTNVLLCANDASPYILTSLSYTSLAYDGQIRAVIVGGPFHGIGETAILDPENLFIRPGEDGSGGNRGGSGQWVGDRNHGDDEEPTTTDLQNQNNPASEDVIKTAGSSSLYVDKNILLIPSICCIYFALCGRKHLNRRH